MVPTAYEMLLYLYFMEELDEIAFSVFFLLFGPLFFAALIWFISFLYNFELRLYSYLYESILCFEIILVNCFFFWLIPSFFTLLCFCEVDCFLIHYGTFFPWIGLTGQPVSSFSFFVQGFEDFLVCSNDFLFMVDGLSLLFIFLVLFLIPICVFCLWNFTRELGNCALGYFFSILILESILIFLFIISDLLYFYIGFESSLLPMFFIIGLWGSKKRKIRALYLFLLYTLFGSFFFLSALLYLNLSVGSLNIFYLLNTQFSLIEQRLLWLCFFFSFAVKIPIFPFHIWLPEAHVEAPTAGSILLAGILLKLGTYGFIRFLLCLFPAGTHYFAPLICTLCMCGVIYGAFNALCQLDLKRIIAYSSVSHMNMIVLGLFSFNVYGYVGAIYQMISHGFIASGLFLCVGFLYERYGTRLVLYFGGLNSSMPDFGIFLFFFVLSNFGFPGTSNFMGEFLIILGLLFLNKFITLFLFLGLIFSCVYSLALYDRVIFGFLKSFFFKHARDLTFSEILLVLMFVIIIFFFGIAPNFIYLLIQCSFSTVIYFSIY